MKNSISDNTLNEMFLGQRFQSCNVLSSTNHFFTNVLQQSYRPRDQPINRLTTTFLNQGWPNKGK